jgi:hypothetical protein
MNEHAEIAAITPEDRHKQVAAKHAEPLLVNARTAAALCSKSLRTWRSWDAMGLIPRPVRLSRSTLWSLEELKSWIAAGCPRRKEWEALRRTGSAPSAKSPRAGPSFG